MGHGRFGRCGLITFARTPRLANSAAQVRTKETKAAFVAAYAPKPGTPICHAAEPERMINALSATTGSAFCTVKYLQVEVLVKRFSESIIP
jgi:hypothetical protein